MADNYRVFLDFDGTITENDVGYEMFRKFTRAATEPLVQAYRRGDVNSRNCLAGECEIWNANPPDAAEVSAFLDSQPLRNGFIEFYSWLKSENIESLILSEGFDFYIDRILESHGFHGINRFTNIGVHSGNLVLPQFPFFGLECDTCSNCKGYHIRRERPPKASALYIGDGHSDLHASKAAEIIFARSHLAEIMHAKGRHFYPYKDFNDIRKQVETIFARGIFSSNARFDFCFVSERHALAINSLWENGEVMKYVGYPNGFGYNRRHYDDIWRKLADDPASIYLAIENSAGVYMGEAKIAFPDDSGYCDHDVKLLPQFHGKGIGFDAWNLLLARAAARWPNTTSRVTPNIENSRAIDLYLRLGFKFQDGIQTWTPSPSQTNAVPVQYRTMLKR